MDERTTPLVRTHLDSVNLVNEYEKLQAENERLKGENIMLRSAGLKQTLEHEQIFKDFIKENAKLKCLVLHLFEHLGFYASEWYSAYDEEGKTRRAVKWWKIHIKYKEAHRKAKKELMEGKLTRKCCLNCNDCDKCVKEKKNERR